MARKTCVKIFISCPGDVEKEKQIAIEASNTIAGIFSSRFVLEVIEWKQNTVPMITGEGAQSVINNQIKDDYDIYIGIFWKRFGEKQPNGFTPTEEEFERAYEHYRKTKKPLISVYFKTDGPQNNSEEQALALRNFKDRIKTLGLYSDFKEVDFKDKIMHDIGYKLENWFSLTSSLINPQITENKDYLKRKVVPSREYNKLSINFTNLSTDLFDVIEKERRVVLLGDAGTGKTTELRRLVWQFLRQVMV